MLEPGFLNSSAYDADPARYWRYLRAEEPLHFYEPDGYWLLSRYDDVLKVLTDSETYATAPYHSTFDAVLGPTLIEFDDAPRHDAPRARVAGALIAGALEEQLPMIRRHAATLARNLPTSGEFDLRAHFTSHMPLAVILELLGLPDLDPEAFIHDVACIIAASDGDEEAINEGRAAAARLTADLRETLLERAASPGSDLISQIVAPDRHKNVLTYEEVASFVTLLLVAGVEILDLQLSNMWRVVLRDRAILAEVTTNPQLLHNLFAETLRRDSALVYLDRELTKPVTWYGTTLPEGSRLRVCIAAANRDERVFASPDVFLLRRGDLRTQKDLRRVGRDDGVAGHLTFGSGKHFCLGYQLARAQMIAATSAMLPEFSNLDLEPTHDSELHIHLLHRGPDQLVVVRK
jgi:cytochrome P450